MFNKKLNQKIDLLIDRVDSLTAKITEIDAKLWGLSCDISNLKDSTTQIAENLSAMDSTTNSLVNEVNELGKLSMLETIDTNDIMNDVEYLTRKLHEAKVIDASELGFDDDDDLPLGQESPKQEETGNEQPKMEFEGGEAIIEKSQLQENKVDADLIKQVAKETNERMVIRKKDREFFRMAFYRKLPQRFHFLSAVGIGANMGLSRYNVNKLLTDEIGISFYEEKSPKIYVIVKKLPDQ